MLTATSTGPVVTAQLPVGQEYLVRRGEQVTVTLPDGMTTTPGIVTAISSVATRRRPAGGQDSRQRTAPGPGGRVQAAGSQDRWR